MNIYGKNMKQVTLLVLFLISVPLAASQVTGQDGGKTLQSAFPGWFDGAPFSSLEADLIKARQEGKQGVMVLFSTAECSYCSEFIKKTLHDPKISAVVQKNFHSVGMEIFEHADMTTDTDGKVLYTNEFARKESAGYSPTIAFYGKDGKRIVRLVGYQSPERFRKVLNEITSN